MYYLNKYTINIADSTDLTKARYEASLAMWRQFNSIF